METLTAYEKEDAQLAHAYLMRDAFRLGLNLDASPAHLMGCRVLARLGFAEYSEGAYRLTQAGRKVSI